MFWLNSDDDCLLFSRLRLAIPLLNSSSSSDSSAIREKWPRPRAAPDACVIDTRYLPLTMSRVGDWRFNDDDDPSLQFLRLASRLACDRVGWGPRIRIQYQKPSTGPRIIEANRTSAGNGPWLGKTSRARWRSRGPHGGPPCGTYSRSDVLLPRQGLRQEC